MFYSVQCSEECTDLFIGETKQPLHTWPNTEDNSSGQDSAVHLHLKDKGHSFEDRTAHVLTKEKRQFERRVKEGILVKLENLSLNRGEGLWINTNFQPFTMLSWGSLPRKFCNRSYLTLHDDRIIYPFHNTTNK